MTGNGVQSGAFGPMLASTPAAYNISPDQPEQLLAFASGGNLTLTVSANQRAAPYGQHFQDEQTL